ncbi:redoxin [Aliidiomarina taiwanensis]|uniref:Redoxin n=1 Tax=Aliidiomarina taiwanensis TaxID=946228 RepID=A0A432XA67_9GAMM|nr:TlpA disulfide reductase family protein [Aliidiomarina taiwanensis]RUO44305.1 redoxin [Aliidiomarina taiwanensis]
MSVSFGPFGFALSHLIFFAACAAALGLASFLGRNSNNSKNKVSDTLFLSLIVAVLVARCSFVLRFSDLYLASPKQILNIRDGGFDILMGLTAGLLFIAYKAWRQRTLVKPLLIATLAGLLVYGGGFYGQQVLKQQHPFVPEITLNTLSAKPVPLAQAFHGQGLVINLWATWCPPCVREMPVLMEAQTQWPNMAIVPVNQGESVAAIKGFFHAHSLAFEHALVDSRSQLSQAVGSSVFPTTLFFDANGLLVDSHIGELSVPRLAAGIQKIEAAK